MASKRKGAGLFDLFKDLEVYAITDPSGQESRIGMRALTYMEHMEVMEKIEEYRTEVRKKYDTTENRDRLLEIYVKLDVPVLVNQMIGVERPLADQLADLAPDLVEWTEEERATLSREDKEKRILAKWEARRRAELEAIEPTLLQHMLLARHMELQISNVVNSRYTELSLVKMVVSADLECPMPGCDTATDGHAELMGHLTSEHGLSEVHARRDAQAVARTPLLSSVATDANYIGALMTETRRELVRCWTEFNQKLNDKRRREVVQSSDFLRSGDSPAVPAATPEPAAVMSSSSLSELSPPSS